MKNSYQSRIDEQLVQTPQEFIINYILQTKVESGKNYSAPYREDKHPSYTIWYDEKKDKWQMKDWAWDEKPHDVFELVKRMHKLGNFEEVLLRLKELTPDIVYYNRRMKYRAVHRVRKTQKSQGKFYQTMDFSHDGERYWNFQSIQTETLERFGVKQVRTVFYGGKPFNATEQQVFVFDVNGTTKIYQPNNPKYKFSYLDKVVDYVFGFDQLPEKDSCVIITGSEKEVMALYEMGIPAVAVESETAKLPNGLVRELKSRFNGVFILYDNDKTGNEKSKELAQEHGLLRLEIPKIEDVKDFTEWISCDGDAGGQLFEQMAEVVTNNQHLFELDIKEDEEEAPIFNPFEPYKISWDTYVRPTTPTISVNGIRIGSKSNISVIVSSHGSGKSSACELITCKMLDPDLDICGLETPKRQKVLLIDTERSKQDACAMFERICRRLGHEEPEAPEGLEAWAMIDITDPAIKMQKITEEVEKGGYGLVIIDGFGDLVRDVNNLQESNLAVQWITGLASKHNLVVLTTLHTNPSNTKARGHAGSELLRKAESVLSVESQFQNGEKVFFINANIKEAKIRSDAGAINMPFHWSEEENMMVPFEGELKRKEKSRAKTKEEYQEIAERLFEPEIGYSHKEAANLLADDLGIKYDAARSNHLIKLQNHDILVKVDSKYYLNSTGDEEAHE